MGKPQGKPGKGANAPFDDPELEARYQSLLRTRRGDGKDIISRSRFLRQLNHAGKNRVAPNPPANPARSVKAPAPETPKRTWTPQQVPPPPPSKRRREPQTLEQSQTAPPEDAGQEGPEPMQVEEASPGGAAAASSSDTAAAAAPAGVVQVEEPSPESFTSPTAAPAAHSELPQEGHQQDDQQPGLRPKSQPETAPSQEPEQRTPPGSLDPEMDHKVKPEAASDGATASAPEAKAGEAAKTAHSLEDPVGPVEAEPESTLEPLPTQVEATSPSQPKEPEVKKKPPGPISGPPAKKGAVQPIRNKASPFSGPPPKAETPPPKKEEPIPVNLTPRQPKGRLVEINRFSEEVEADEDSPFSPEEASSSRRAPAQDEVPSPPLTTKMENLTTINLPIPSRLTGVATRHRGSKNSPWTCYCPREFKDSLGRSWEVQGIGGARVVLRPPNLGQGSGHQVLKVGDLEQTKNEAYYFSRLSRDFTYITRPAQHDPITVQLQNYGEIRAYGCYYPRVFPVDKAPGNLRQLSDYDMLLLAAMLSHLGLMFIRVADVGGHNVGFQVETLAEDPQENLLLQTTVIRQAEALPLCLYDAGRWRVQATRTFPSQKNLKGFWGMLKKHTTLFGWLNAVVREHSLEGVAQRLLHRLRCTSPKHWEIAVDQGIIQFIPLTFQKGLTYPAYSPWEDPEGQGVPWTIAPIASTATPAT